MDSGEKEAPSHPGNSILKLSNEYGGSFNIPEEALNEHGYVRLSEPDGTVRLIPQSRLSDIQQHEQDRNRARDALRPFQTLSVDVPMVTREYRRVPDKQLSALRRKAAALEQAFAPEWDDGIGILSVPTHEGSLPFDIDQGLVNLRIFTEDILPMIHDEFTPVLDMNGARQLFLGVLPERSEEVDNPFVFSVPGFLEERVSSDGSVSTTTARAIYQELSTMEGYYTDTPEVKAVFERRLNTSLTEGYFNEPDEIQMFQKRRLSTYADVVRAVFPKYLESVGLTETSAVIRSAARLSEIPNTLTVLDAQDPYKEVVRELKGKIKNADHTQRQVLSAELKALETEQRKRRQIRQGVIDYFNMPEIYAQRCKRRIRDIQKFLLRDDSSRTGQRQIILDATDNEQLDADPGRVSGDCTAGKPLPFNRADIPAYNVKVFEESQQHVGNIYLLRTSLQRQSIDEELPPGSEEASVWHIDAFQIPSSEIDWESGIEQLLSPIIEQAEAQGVTAITANGVLHQISNFDYIANAVREYWESHGKQVTDVKIPVVNSSIHSEFQGDGHAIVLWSKEPLSEPFDGELDSDSAFFGAVDFQDEEDW